MLRATRTEICLPNLSHNIAVIRSSLRPETKFLAVVKANAYGHGLEEVARYVAAHGADYLGVAIAEEGVRLREAGIDTPILILGASMDTHIDCILDYGLTPTVFSIHTLQSLQEAAAARQKTCRFHFKVDTGMNRIGFVDPDAFQEALDYLAQCPNLVFEGMFTHFAVSELPDKRFTLAQAERFEQYVALAARHGYRPLLHACNSGGALELPALQYDMVRGGIALYGYHPAGSNAPDVGLRPVLSWKTNVVNVKDIPSGETVSYGRTFTASRPTRVATLPVGYGDGYKRCLSNRAYVLIHGRRAPQIGTVCMDQIMCDVTDIPDVQIGDEVVLLGTQGEETITADEMAQWADTISYEILLCISERVPRVFLP